MSCPLAEIPLDVTQGLPFSESFRWMQPFKAFKPISAASQAAPCVLTVPNHGVPPGWPFAISGAKGMTALNRGDLDEDRDLYEAIVVDANTIRLNTLNAAALPAYTGGGVVEYFLPEDLSVYTEAESQWRAQLAATTAFETLKKTTGEIVLDNTNKLITLQLTDAVRTADLPITGGVYNLILTPAAGAKIVLIPNSPVRVSLSATR